MTHATPVDATPDDAGSRASPAPSVEPGTEWAWAHEETPEPQSRISAAEVAAILVVHDGAEWLARSLVALGRLDDRPGLVIAVDADSRDGSRDLLDKAVDEGLLDEVVDAPSGGFGQALQAVVPLLPRDHVWLWLLHDDAEPRRTALRELLLAVSAADPTPDVVFPALLQPQRRNHATRVSEVGQSVTLSGDRHLSIDPGEIDQRQLDPGDTLGGSSCGMLLTRSAYDALGGFDPDVPLHRDGLDLGWRAQEAGLTVRTAPAAGIHHRQAGRLQDRPGSVDPALDRQWGMRVVAAHATHPSRSLVWLTFTAMLKGVGLLLGKSPRAALAWFRAARGIAGDRAVVRRMHGRNPNAGLPIDRALRPTPAQTLRAAAERLFASFADRYRDLREDHSDTSIDALTGDDFSGGRSSSRLASPTSVVLVAMAVTALVVARHHLGVGHLVGPRLLPAPQDLGQAYRLWAAEPVALPGSNAPWIGWSALGSTLAFGSPELFARLLVLGAPVVGTATCLLLMRWVLRDKGRWLQAGLSALWGMGVALLGSTGRGLLATSLTAVVMPLAALAAVRWFALDRQGREPGPGDAVADEVRSRPGTAELWRAPASLALWLGVMATATPVFALVALPFAALHGLARSRWSGRTLLVAVGPTALIATWIPRLLHHPGRMLTSADPLATAHPDLPAGMWLLVGGSVGGWTAWLSAAVIAATALAAVAAAIVSAFAGRSGPLGWIGIAVSSFGLALVLGKRAFLLDGAVARPAIDVWLLMGFGALVVSLALSYDDAARREGGRVLTRSLMGVTLALVVAAGVAWIPGDRIAALSVQRSSLPSYVLAVQDSPRRSRTLMIDLSSQGVVSWNVVSRTQPRWGSGEQNPAGDEAAALALGGLVKQIAEGATSDELAQSLRARGIGHLWLRSPSTAQASGLNNAPGLVPGYVDDSTRVWTVSEGATYQPPARRWGVASVVVESLVALLLIGLAAPVLGAPSGASPRRARGEVDR
ncbi:glycosyltransferase family 2 protein [Aestuariimicrobium kwangyangense]|uniref:glycosyltransferase family 2 protein n=1 Tax=Aestuariimicrobium kwangyangense TaxID=396389 RepID=UPI0003B65F71|nr:glycosyltransferase family 2 protein [Aestuariimicrobium kwangyangense]